MTGLPGKKVLIAPDKFKGSLTVFEAAEAIFEGIRLVSQEVEITCSPIADGGEGTTEVLGNALGGIWRKIEVKDPIGRAISARYCWTETRSFSSAILEMSEASGMRRLKPNEFDPMSANTFGTGQLILDAINQGADRIIVGLGGSATNDGGIGMAAALGFRFLDRRNKELMPIPSELAKLERIAAPKSRNFPEIIAAADVENPLLGPKGAAKVYAPQKGADGEQVKQLEANLAHLAEIVKRDLGFSGFDREGSGAAGGLGFGLAAFCGAEIVSGFEWVSEVVGLEENIRSSDLVITGEGKLDAQTLHGKGPAGVANLARKNGRPVIAFAGSIDDAEQFEEVFDAVIAINPSSVEIGFAMENAADLLRASVKRTMKSLPVNL